MSSTIRRSTGFPLEIPSREAKGEALISMRYRESLGYPNYRWSLCFTHDAWGRCEGGRFRTLNIVDDYTREHLVIELDVSLSATRVSRVLD